MNAYVTKIELAKPLKVIRAVATNEQFERINKIYILPRSKDSVVSDVDGLSKEDEFALLTKL